MYARSSSDCSSFGTYVAHPTVAMADLHIFFCPAFFLAMNASITGAWAKQRQLSLNSPVPPPKSAAAAAAARAAKGEDSSEAGPSRAAEPKTAKRKSRSSRTDATKRGRTSKNARATSDEYDAPTTRLRDIGGAESAIEKALELVAMPLCHPEIYLHTGVTPPRGVLFHGPPGCGKTMMAGALAGVRIATHTGTRCAILVGQCAEHRVRHVGRVGKGAA